MKKKKDPDPLDNLNLGENFNCEPPAESPKLLERAHRLLIGKPRDLSDQSIFHSVSLIALLAWVGLGADGLSSSCYGPPVAFANLGEHRLLAVFLAMAVVGTVFIISICYSHIIEEFPSGGGGYLVASKLLGRRVGVVSGCALLVDYVLTITVSIAAAGDALFGLLAPEMSQFKLYAEIAAILVLLILNLRGVKESVQILLPIFVVFLLVHAMLIVGSLVLGVSETGQFEQALTTEVRQDFGGTLGIFGTLALLLHAYSLGAGTYTGIEAVSNSMPVMREPRVATAKRTMFYMACSLAFTAGGLLIAYLLLGVRAPEAGTHVTMNQTLSMEFIHRSGLERLGLGGAFVFTVLVSEGMLLFVAAQAGFIDGPRVLANMAHDSWMPRWFANLSERLASHNGILLMGAAALAALWYTRGDVASLVVIYSINVFLTFSLSMIGMTRHWWGQRGKSPIWRRRLAVFILGAVLCLSILGVTIYQKFEEGAWFTLLVTGTLIGCSFLIHRYYQQVGQRLAVLDRTLRELAPKQTPNLNPPDPEEPAAVILVGAYSGLGIHTLLNAVRYIPNHFKSFIFVSVGVVDSGNFKGSGAVEALRQHTQEALDQYVNLGQRLGVPSTSFLAVGTDPVDELERLCLDVARKYPKSVVFAGQLVFRKETWLQRFMHNQTAYSLQRRLHWAGRPMIILPTRVP